MEYLVYAPQTLTSDFAQQLVRQQAEKGIACLAVGEDVFQNLASKDNPQGIMAVVRQPRLKLEDLSVASFQWGVALVAPQDPGNIGSILRTIDAVGASGLLVLDDPDSNQYSADPFHPNSVRASMGAIFWYPVVTAVFSNFVRWVRLNGFHVYGTSAHSSLDYLHFEGYDRPLILLMGSEREGLTPDQSAPCDEMLGIPMRGRVTSLNLAIATGVMLYSILGKLR